jgi:hypothetical protein
MKLFHGLIKSRQNLSIHCRGLPVYSWPALRHHDNGRESFGMFPDYLSQSHIRLDDPVLTALVEPCKNRMIGHLRSGLQLAGTETT